MKCSSAGVMVSKTKVKSLTFIKTFNHLILSILLGLTLSSCGISLGDHECNAIKKQSSDKMDVGRAIFEMAMEGKVGNGMTVEGAKIQGYRYMMEASTLVLSNSRCFSADEVSSARNLLGK